MAKRRLMKQIGSNRNCLAVATGGSTDLANPSSFTDANGLFLGNGTLTIVDGKLDTIENQGTDGADASGIATTNRIPIAPGLGKYSFRDLLPSASSDFRATGFSTTALSAFTIEGVTMFNGNYNPERITTSLGSLNAGSFPCVVWVGNGGIRITMKGGGTQYTAYCSQASAGIQTGVPFSFTITYNGAGASFSVNITVNTNCFITSFRCFYCSNYCHF